MPQGFGPRALAAIVLVSLAAAAGLVLGGRAGLTVAWLGGLAAVVIAAGAHRDEPIPSPAPEPAAQPDIAELLDAVVAPLLVVDGGVVVLANRAARRLLGDVEGEDVRVAIRHPAAAERLAEGGEDARPIELVGLGMLDQRWELRVDTLADERRLVHLVDRTGSYAAERMRVDFVANASHELRTPLASILGYVETLRDGAGGETALRERFLAIIDDEARRMQRLIEDLISLSRIEADKYRAPATAVDLATLAGEVRAELSPTAEARGSTIDLAAEPDLPDIAGDRAQLSQMLHNLIGNALKYGQPGTPVTVAVRHAPGDMVKLTIADRGEGIAPEHLPRLTERFYRADAGRSRAMGGTGLGLAIVKHIVERHRGRLSIASTLGQGTAVTVLLPEVSPNRHATAIQAGTPGTPA